MPDTTHEIDDLLRQLSAGDATARDRLLARSMERLRALADRMVPYDDRLRGWTQVDDILQGALVRLTRALEAILPKDAAGLLKLCAEQIRREARDVARKVFGPHGDGSHQVQQPADGSSSASAWKPHDVDGETPSETLEQAEFWLNFWNAVDRLSPDELTVFDLMHSQELSLKQAAACLDVSIHEVRRRWYSVRQSLGQVMVDSQFSP